MPLPPRPPLKPLEEPYRSRAAPAGTARYWSWLFAAREARAPLLAVYALTAEWRALMDAGTEASVAQIKLAWWREEIGRLAGGSPLHPVTRHLLELPRAAAADFAPLAATVDAVTAQAAGAPLERASEFQSHAAAMHGIPLLIAAQLSGGHGERPAVRTCAAALAAGEYLARVVTDYGREIRAGRVPFIVEELLAAGIDDDDLAAPRPSARLQRYLEELRRRAAGYFAAAASTLSMDERPPLRHLEVLAVLGAKHLNGARNPASAAVEFTDLYDAWRTARRAAAAR